MFLTPDGRVYVSASDLKAAVECEWALMRKLDSKLGRIDAVEEVEDLMLARASLLGSEHEERKLRTYRDEFGVPRDGGGVVEIERPEPSTDPVALARARDETVAALRRGVDVVFQGTFIEEATDDTPGFVGFADFLVKSDPATGAYDVYDTKLARKAKVTALLQLAAYAEQLTRLGIPVGPVVHLILGNGEPSHHKLNDILPVFRDRLARLHVMVRDRLADAEPIAWGAPGTTACGRCEWCTPEVERTRDVILVAGMRTTQRARLAEAGIRTIDELAASTAPVEGIGDLALEKLRAQARMQLAAPPDVEGRPREVRYEVAAAAALAALPPPDPGDVFFDFEGDPLWTDDTVDWGLDYLWGLVTVEPDGRPAYRAFWAHDRAQERQALIDFLDFVQERRARHPGMHIYHYADYERAHLLQLAARYGVGEAVLDELLTENVFVDLYPIVRRSIRISENSYSIKKLEPLYMGDEVRTGELTRGDESIQFYVDYTELRDAGRLDEAQHKLDVIADYNEYDCVSTLRLRDWLLDRAREHGVEPVAVQVEREARDEQELADQETRLRERLYAHIEGIPDDRRSDDERAIALAGAAIEYHRREAKAYWWEHFARQQMELDEFADTRDVLIVEDARVLEDWAATRAGGIEHRTIRLRGQLGAGSRLAIGDSPYAMYEPPAPEVCGTVPPGHRGEHNATRIVAIAPVPGRVDVFDVDIDERAAKGAPTWDALPIALTPKAPIPTRAQRQAILHWAGTLAEALEAGRDLPQDAALDILRRVPPHTATGLEPVGIDGPASAIADSLLRLDRSYLAVQGPPGSGKTTVGGRVIAHLVTEHRWRVGVVAQSHEVVENLLRRVVAEGVPGAQVGKRPPSERGYPEPPGWTVLPRNEELPAFIAEHHDEGFVLGGTAWDFANAGKVARGVLDLLVIDEAGQYSLANTIAVSVAAQRLLLLGDPQQLPQVTTGAHPEPIDESALGWLSAGHDVLPAELGYFLEETWRMHPALTRAVSDLSYEGRLQAHPSTAERMLAGVDPGLHAVPVEHTGNSTESPEEAARVVELVKQHLGARWVDPRLGRDDGLQPSDVIVVAPYNAQVELIRRMLDAEGLQATPVGTVDKFQGQEAVIAIVSLTASSAAEVPRGIGFLLQRNRLNVAISRGRWAAYLVHSPGLRHHLPNTPKGLAELSGYIRLTTG